MPVPFFTLLSALRLGCITCFGVYQDSGMPDRRGVKPQRAVTHFLVALGSELYERLPNYLTFIDTGSGDYKILMCQNKNTTGETFMYPLFMVLQDCHV